VTVVNAMGANVVVKVAHVSDHLPAGTPRFSVDDRRAQLAQRRRGIARRFRR